jgi:hypothetical protein
MSAAVSAVLVTDTFETAAETIEHLRRQTIADRIELVLAAPTAAAAGMEERVGGGFHGVCVVALPSIDRVEQARAEAIRAAGAPIVFVAETHSFPETGSIEALVERHRGPWAVVGQAMCNANPATLVSWSNLCLDYGPWLSPAPGGEIASVPTHNSSFKRDPLVRRGDDLAGLMEAGDFLVEWLRSEGYRFYLEPRARTHHLNVSKTRPWLLERLTTGRAYAARRSQEWSGKRRAAYIASAALIPAVRLARIHGDLRRTGLARELLPRLYPTLAVGLVVSACGELLGYAFGKGASRRVLDDIELHRRSYVHGGEPTYR